MRGFRKIQNTCFNRGPK